MNEKNQMSETRNTIIKSHKYTNNKTVTTYGNISKHMNMKAIGVIIL